MSKAARPRRQSAKERIAAQRAAARRAQIRNRVLITGGSALVVVRNPASPLARGADGAANYITATICKMTGNQPASVCTTPAISALAAKL